MEFEWGCIDGKDHFWVPKNDGYRMWTSDGTNYDPGAKDSVVMRRWKCAMCYMEKHQADPPAEPPGDNER